MNKKLIVYLLTAMIFLVLSSTDIFISSLPAITNSFKVSASISSLMISSFTLGIAVFSLIVGVLSERFGRRKIILSGLLIYFIASVLIFISPWMYGIIFFRIIQSLGASFIVITSRLIIKDILNIKEQVKATGTLLLGAILSPALAPSIGSFLASYFDWRACFSFSAFSGLILLILTLFYIPETGKSFDSKLPGFKPLLNSYGSLFSDYLLTPSLILVGAVSAGYYSFITISSFLFIRKYGMTPENYSYLFIMIAGGYFIGNMIMRNLSMKGRNLISITRTGILYTTSGTLIVMLSYFTDNRIFAIIILTIGATVLRMSIALINSPINILIVNHFRKKGGHALGLTYFSMLFGSTIGSGFVSFFSSIPVVGLQVSCLLFLGISIIGFFLLIRGTGIITGRFNKEKIAASYC